MLKKSLVLWMVFGTLLGLAYFIPPVQSSMRRAEAEGPMRDAQEARRRSVELSTGVNRSPAVSAEAVAEWKKVLDASNRALAALDGGPPRLLVLLKVLRAEAMAQTGQADTAFRELEELERTEWSGNIESSEAVRAMFGQVNFQVSLMIQAESNSDDSWRKYRERAAAIYQDLLKSAEDEDSVDVYRKNLACVARSLYGEEDGSTCWSMPPQRTVDCKKKMRRLERDNRNGGGGRATRYNKTISDANNVLRAEQIQKTASGEDEGK